MFIPFNAFGANDSNGARSAFASVYERAQTAAESDIPIFLWGEPGVGKETLARTIAKNSDRSDAPFVKLRCDRLSARSRDVLFPPRRDGDSTFVFSSELCDEIGSGVLYFAEIDAAPFDWQRRLAGAIRENAVPFRLIFGSSQDFRKARQNGAFASELESILAAFPIFLPPLRERNVDLAELTTEFLRDAARKFGVWPRRPTDRELEIVAALDYPENLRDLRRYLENVAATDVFDADFAPGADARPQPDASESSRAVERIERIDRTERSERSERSAPEKFPSLDDAIRQHVAAALRLTNGVVEGPFGAAALLQINPHTLRSRMRKLKIERSQFVDEDAP